MSPSCRRIVRLRLIAAREARRFLALAAAREGRGKPSFRPLTATETEIFVGVELLAALENGCRRP